MYWRGVPSSAALTNPNGHLYRYAPLAQLSERVFAGPVLGGATLQRDGGIALFGMHGAVILWSGRGAEPIADGVAGVRGTRFNDAVADSTGRVLTGTMPTATRESMLVRIEPDGSDRVVLGGLGQSNGMVFDPDERVLFHVDTRHAVLRAYDYDLRAGQPGPARVVRRFDAKDGVPDGMAADEEGSLWVAMWGGGCVIRIDPSSGREIDRLRVPTPLTSSVAFGGPDLSDLYITTAGGDERARHGELAGSLFAACVGIRGAPRRRSALGASVSASDPRRPLKDSMTKPERSP
jgi:D-xylonolactonase